MTHSLTTERQDLGPISPNWTIRELVDWLSDDTRVHDHTIHPALVLIETALTGASWTGTPSTIALIRSLAAAVRTEGDVRISDVLSSSSRTPRPVEQVRVRELASFLPGRVA